MIPRAWIVGVAGSLFVHVMCARAAFESPVLQKPPAPPMDVALVVKEPPPVEVPPEPPPVAPPPSTAATQKRSPARAGRVLDAAPAAASTEPVDFSIVEGAANAYVGGTTAATGTSDRPVHGATAPTPAKKAAPDPSVPAVAASPAGSEWDCSSLYPADATNDESAAVLIRVRVDARGAPALVEVLKDPGHGFGEAARFCALKQTYQPARNSAGEPVAGVTSPFLVRFHR